MVRVEEMSFGFNKEKQVLKNITFEIGKGETLAIVGASGSGKSTLLRIMSGILPNSKSNHLSGNINIDGLTPDQYRQTGKLAFMFQESTLMPHLSVKQNIELPLRINDVRIHEDINHLIQVVGLEEFSSYFPKQLSGGMKTRTALARSFTTKPELLLLDEPFSALDIAWKSNLYMELNNLREETGTTVIIVTHDVQEALLLADHVLVLNNTGEIEDEKHINSQFTINQRVHSITDYMNSVYDIYMLPIQEAIINGQRRKNEK